MPLSEICPVCNGLGEPYFSDEECDLCNGYGAYKPLNCEIKWVRQEDEKGCVIACLAMVAGITYQEAKAEMMEGWEPQHGASMYHAHQFLKKRHISPQWRKWEWYNGKEWYYFPEIALLDVQVRETDPKHIRHCVLCVDGVVYDSEREISGRMFDYYKIDGVTSLTPCYIEQK